MANPTWFIKEDYLLSKLAQLQKLDPAAYGSWNIVTVDEALKAAGYTNAYDHFAQFGALERTSPNAYFDANEYLAAKAAQLNAAKHGGRTDWTAEGVALAINDAGLTPYTHFNLVGWEEGVNPSNKFDVKAYLESKAAQLNKDKVDGKTDWTADDVKAAFKSAGFDPISHYEAAGSAESITVTPAKDPITPPDVVGETFTLTTATGEKIVGTAGNDEVRGVAGHGTDSSNTLNIGDTIDGGAGKDTLNLTFQAGSAAPAAGVEIKNVEVVNLDIGSARAHNSFLSSSLYSGVQELWQVNGNAQQATSMAADSVTSNTASVAESVYNDVVVGAGVTAGFKGNGKAGTDAAAVLKWNAVVAAASSDNASAATSAVDVKTATSSQKEVSIALDGVGDGSSLSVSAAGTGKIETVNISGTVAREGATADGDLFLAVHNTDTKTVVGTFTSGVDFTINTAGAVETIDLSGSTGAIDLAGTFGALKSLKLGSANDTATVVTANTNDVVVDAGAGNDVITLETGNAANKAVAITLGEGNDTVAFARALINVRDTAAESFQKGLVKVEDFSVGSDVLNVKITSVSNIDVGAANLANIAKAATLEAAVKAAAALNAGAGAGDATIVFGHGDNTYVLFDNADSGTYGTFNAGDGLVELTGVSVTDLISSSTSFLS